MKFLTLSHITTKQKVLILLFILAIISLAYIYSFSQTSSPTLTSTQPTPRPPSIPQFLYVDPPPGKYESFWTTQAIEFKFDQPMDIYSMKYSITPTVSVKIAPSIDKTSIYIRPTGAWEFNQIYQINISTINSETGIKILNPITSEFNLVPPKDVISQ